MLSSETMERLRQFRLSGFIDALAVQCKGREYKDLSFEDRLTLLVDAEHTRRSTLRVQRLLNAAQIQAGASMDAVNFSLPRGLEKKRLLELVTGSWIEDGAALIITGPTGIGKTFVASALSHALCSRGITVRLKKTLHWLAELSSLSEQRRLDKAFKTLRRTQVLIFDEWMRDPLTPQESRLLLDLIDDHHGYGSCVFLSQYKVPKWHARFPDPVLADAIMDRLVHGSIRFELDGDSLRGLEAQKRQAQRARGR